MKFVIVGILIVMFICAVAVWMILYSKFKFLLKVRRGKKNEKN